MKFSVFIAIAMMLSGWNVTLANPVEVPRDEPLVTIDFPGSWRVKHIDLWLRTGTPGGEVVVVCQSVVTGTKATKEDAGDTIAEMLTEGLNPLKLNGKPNLKETMVDGARAFKLDATGTYKNSETVAEGYLIPISEDRGFVLAYWGTPTAMKNHAALLKQVIGSIHRKVK